MGGRVGDLPPPAKVFDLAQARILRQHGHMACRRIRDHGGRGPGELFACHMLSPGRIEVQGGFGVSRFDPGPGGPATLLVDRAGARCVTRINPALFVGSADRAYD